MPEHTDQFYSELPLNKISVNQLVADKNKFFPVPDDWYVVITDIKSSTQAIKDGLHQVVNLVATGSVIAGLNLSRKANITIPFFFGGDGASLLVPASLVDPLMGALDEHRENTAKNFGLELRVGHLPVTKIYEKESPAKYFKSKNGRKILHPCGAGCWSAIRGRSSEREGFCSFFARDERTPSWTLPEWNAGGIESSRQKTYLKWCVYWPWCGMMNNSRWCIKKCWIK